MKKLNVLIITIVLLLSGCGTGNVISDKTDSSVSEKITVRYQQNNSWQFSGNGKILLSGYAYQNKEMSELFCKEYTISKPLTVSFFVDENKNLSVYTSHDSSTYLYKTGLENTEEADTGYILAKDTVLEENAIPLFLECRDMTSIQSDFEEDYTTLEAEWAVLIVAGRI